MFRTASYKTIPVHPFESFMHKIIINCPPDKHIAQQQILSDEHRLNEIFEQVVCLPEHQRPVFLDKNCNDVPELRSKIEELLKGADQTPPDNFLDPSNVTRLLKKLSDFDNSDSEQEIL